jgi:hypothetical protein
MGFAVFEDADAADQTVASKDGSSSTTEPRI